MPVKKKKAKKRRVNRTIKKDIARAVEDIPRMIMREIEIADRRPSSPHVIKRPERSRHLLMWTGVAVISSVVFAMWFLNTKNTLSAIRQGAPSQERQLVSTAREDLRAIMKSLAESERNELSAAVGQTTPAEIKTTVKNALTSLFLTAATASSSSTAVTTTAATSTETTNASSTSPSTTTYDQ